MFIAESTHSHKNKYVCVTEFQSGLTLLISVYTYCKSNLLYYDAGHELGKRPWFLNYVFRSPYVFFTAILD